MSGGEGPRGEGPWGEGPWAAAPQPPPRRPRSRRWGLWLLLCAALVGLVAALARAFPEAVRTREQWAFVAGRAGMVALVAAGVLRARGRVGRGHLRHAAAWAAVVAALALGFAFRNDLAGVGRRLQLAFSDGAPVSTAAHEIAMPQDAQGGFMVVGRVNGERVRFVVDTGATDTVLSPDDARRVGIDVDHLRYEREAETANGLGYGAPYEVARLEVGPAGFDRFEVVVNKAPMSASLLGLSFLRRMDSYEVRDRQLILRWR